MNKKLVPIFIAVVVVILGGVAYLYQSGVKTSNLEYSTTPPAPQPAQSTRATQQPETNRPAANGNVNDAITAFEANSSTEISASEKEDQDADVVTSDGGELKNLDQSYDENSL